MGDDLRKAFAAMRKDLVAVKERFGAAETAIAEVLARLGTVETSLQEAGTRFDTFLVRFDEVCEMLVEHDTEQLKRVTAVENENAALKQQYALLKQQWQDLALRVEALERKPPAA